MILTAKRVASIAFVLLLLYWIFEFLKGFQWEKGLDGEQVVSFNWHALLMTLAFVLVMNEGVFAFRLQNGEKVGPTSPHRHARKLFHMGLNFLAVATGTAGITIIFVNHAQHGYAHLHSAHSWFGVATASLVLLQFLAGFYFFWFTTEHHQLKQRFLPHHRLAGKLILFLSLSTIALGLFEKQTFIGTKDLTAASAWAATLAVLLVPVAAIAAYGFASPLHAPVASTSAVESDADP
eukprot:EG_transcript_19366